MGNNIDDLLSLLDKADEAYHTEGTPIMSDSAYDALREKVPGHTKIGAPVKGAKHELPIPMPSLDQIPIGGLEEWRKSHDLAASEILITPKADGISVLLWYQHGNFHRAFTRGDGSFGKDITAHLAEMGLAPQSIPLSQPASGSTDVYIRGELIMHVEDFHTYNAQENGKYANPRNCVAGIFNRSQPDMQAAPFIRLYTYQLTTGNPQDAVDKGIEFIILSGCGFQITQPEAPASFVDVNRVTSELLENAAVAAISKYRDTLPYEIDGVVLYVGIAGVAQDMDAECGADSNPRSAIKYKVAAAENSAVTIVRAVEWKLSKHRYYKPTIVFDPVYLVGVTISRCSGFNAKFIQDNKIGPGASIEITRSGDVIPYCKAVVIPSETVSLPAGDWNETGVDLLAKKETMSIQDTKEVTVASMVDFFERLEIDGLGQGNLSRLYDSGLIEVSEVVNAPLSEIQAAVGSDITGSQLFCNLRGVLDAPLYKLFGAANWIFGRGLGVRKFKALFHQYTGDNIFDATEDEIVLLDGFDVSTAQKIVDGLPSMKEFLESIMYEIPESTKPKPLVANAAVPTQFRGKTLMFTGFRDSWLEERIRNGGGYVKASGGVTKSVDILVCKDKNSSSSKAVQARVLKIPIYSVAELREMLDSEGV